MKKSQVKKTKHKPVPCAFVYLQNINKGNTYLIFFKNSFLWGRV